MSRTLGSAGESSKDLPSAKAGMSRPNLYSASWLQRLSPLLYCGFALVLFFPVLSHLTTTYIGGEPGPAAQDPLSFMWFLTWTPYALSHHHNLLLTDWIFSDSGANLTWNNAVPFVGLVMGPITVSAGPIVSYNLAVIASVIASAWAAYYVTFRLFRVGVLPALLSGAVYGFSPFMTAHAVGHLHLVPAFTPPLFFLVLHDVIITQQQSPWTGGARLALLVLVQYFISTEVLLANAVFASIGLCLLVASCRRAITVARVRYVAHSLSAAVLIALPVLSYPLYLAFFGPWRPVHPIHESADFYTASLLSFVVPSSAQAILGSRFLTSSSAGGEWNTYLGLPLIALLVVIGRAKRGDGAFRFFLAMLGVITICALGPSVHLAGPLSTGIPLPWRLVDLLPIFRDVQTNRFGEYLYLLVGVVLALYVSDESVPRLRRAGRVAVSLAAVAFLFPRIPLYPATNVDVPEFFRSLRDAQTLESPALVIPLSTGALLTNRATAMLWQAESGMAFKMPEGYAFGQGKPPWPAPTFLSAALLEIEDTGRAPPVTQASKARVVAVLEQQRIRTVVLGPFEHERETLNFLTGVLGAPTPADGVFVWRVAEGASIERLGRDGATAAPLVNPYP